MNRYRIRYQGPDLEGRDVRGTASYAVEGTAVKNFRMIVASRRVRAPRSSVVIEDRLTDQVLARWDGRSGPGDEVLRVSPDLAERWDIE